MTTDMKRGAHTPGPWMWLCEPGKGGTLNAAKEKVIDHANYEGMWFATYDEPTDAANARLIAAAPDLLAALRDCVVRIEALTGGIDTSLYAARAAIARATWSEK